MLDRATVEHIARLARLELTPEETELYRRQLSEIIAYIDKLKELDCDGVEPLLFPGALSSVFREDLAHRPLDPHDALRNAPSLEGPFFKVPRVIEE
ncbi:MAG: hypothetical protein A2Z34_11625 [Planctomycetes bacterium RBG_16_59_8]|nr:MAG: hypothetical protein A2Z34_11625 [Planctomycetes bacterium RBG_16_59_8]